MAKTLHITGTYTIPAKSTEVFTFWWPIANQQEQKTYEKAYFDVSIAPEFDGINAVITPLVEVKRERTLFFQNVVLINKTLFLTLQNDNDFPVTFLAAHVLIN
jgi:hypothetical protein